MDTQEQSSPDAEKNYQNPTSLILKVLKKFKIEEIYTKIMKVIHKKSIFGIILSGEICKSFPLALGKRQGHSIISLLIQYRTRSLRGERLLKWKEPNIGEDVEGQLVLTNKNKHC